MENSLKVGEERVADVTKMGRRELVKKFGSWCSAKATDAEIISWCDARIAHCNEWLQNLQNLKLEKQKALVAGLSPDLVRQLLAAKPE